MKKNSSLRTSIEVLRSIDLTHEKFMSEYGFPNKPVVISDGAWDWKAWSLWTLNFFKSEYGRTRLKVTKNLSEGKTRANIMTVSEYIDYVQHFEEDNPYYLRDWTLEIDFPELLDDYTIPSYFQNWLDRIPIEENRPWWMWKGWKGWIFIGPKRTGTQPHEDVVNSSAWLALIQGKKKWAILPPDNGQYLYEGKADVLASNYEKYPLLAKANPIYYTQQPGEIVFVPSGWWHQVHNEDVSISLSGNFINESNCKHFTKYLKDNNMHDDLRQFIQHIPELG